MFILFFAKCDEAQETDDTINVLKKTKGDFYVGFTAYSSVPKCNVS